MGITVWIEWPVVLSAVYCSLLSSSKQEIAVTKWSYSRLWVFFFTRHFRKQEDTGYFWFRGRLTCNLSQSKKPRHSSTKTDNFPINFRFILYRVEKPLSVQWKTFKNASVLDRPSHKSLYVHISCRVNKSVVFSEASVSCMTQYKIYLNVCKTVYLTFSLEKWLAVAKRLWRR